MPRIHFVLCLLALFCFPALTALPTTAALAQTATPAETEPEATLKVNARTVLVDVVVIDKDGKTVPGLKKEDFEVTENGRKQTVNFFEPHFSEMAMPAAAAAPLPANTFTNVPKAPQSEAVNVLLMDAMNTQLTDQAYVRLQMVKYLGQVPPGIRVGVFMLGNRLKLIQGFTEDSSLLKAAVAKYSANPSPSALLGSSTEISAQNSGVAMIQNMATQTGSAQLGQTAAAFQDFLGQEASFEANQRLEVTLESLQTIARYLAGVPGRKNLIWFVGSFPLCTPGSGSAISGCPYEDMAEKTINMLAEARVSVYPVDATGVVARNGDIGGPSGGTATNFQSLIASQIAQMGAEDRALAGQLSLTETWAEKTGGKAYHTNDIRGEIVKAIENGSRYYTLAYTPPAHEEEGRERKIEVQIPSGRYKLEYRRTYYERTAKEVQAAAAAPAKDPLRPLMDRGMPSFSQLRYRVNIEPLGQITDGPLAGDNPAAKGPLTRYRVTFALEPGGVTLTPGPDGVRRGNVEVALMAYSQPGAPLNWLVRSVGLAIRPNQVAIAESTGIPLHFEFDAPNGDVFLRMGIYDSASSHAGTLEVPLTSLTVASK
jgi:VWFA-related protein